MRRLIAIVGFSLFLSGLSLLASSSPSYAATTTTRVTANDSRTVRIIAGSDRYETAVLVSRAGFPQGAPAVVIARGDDYADALCSAPLAYAYGGPLLLTPAGGLPDTVVAEIRRLNPSQVFLVGIGDGSSTILRQVRQVTRAASITTLVGRDRYETAALVADQLRVKAGAPSKVVIAPGDTFADALSVGPLAAVNHWPILYTPQHGTLPRVTRDEIAKLGVDSALEIGTYARLELRDVDRIVGVDRYDTCAKVARYSLDHGLNTAHVAFATGETFPDGLAAAPYLALDKGVLLLTKGAMTTTPVREFLTPRAAGVRILEAVGLSTVPAGPWVTSGTTTPPASGQDNTEPDPDTTETPTVPPSSTTTTTTARPTTTTTQFTPSQPTTTTSPPTVTTTTVPPTTTTTLLPTTTTTVPSSAIDDLRLSDNQILRNVTVNAAGASYGIAGFDVTGVRIENVSVNGHAEYGMKIGSSPTQNSLTVNGLTIRDSDMGAYLDCVENSTFTDLDINAPRLSTTQVHSIYIESDCRNLSFKDSTFAGGSGYTVHLWQGEQVADAEVSRNITFENCVIDARRGRYPVVIGPGFDNVKFLNCTFYGNGSGQIFLFYGGSNILIDGFTASGCEELIDGQCESAIIRNGTYDGPQIGTASGVSVSNVRLSTVTPTTTTRSTTTTTTAPPTTTTRSTTTTTAPPTTTTRSTTTTTISGGQTASGTISLQSNRTYSNLSIDATGDGEGIEGAGVSGVVIKNVTVKGGEYGLKVGSGPVSSFTADHLTITGSDMGMYLDNVHDTLLTNLDVYAPRDTGTNQTHALYAESDVVNLTVRNSIFRGGSGYTIHLYHGTGADESEAGTISKNITFENCVIDARQGRYPVVIGEGVDNVKFLNCTFYGLGGQVFLFYGGSNILIDGFTAYGTDDLIDGDCQSATIRNGTYYGPKIGSASGVTVSNVTLMQ